MAGATRAANKRAASTTEVAAPDSNIETITPAEAVPTRTRLDPEAVSFTASEVVKVVPQGRNAVRFGEDHPLYLDYVDSYEKNAAHRLATEDPETLIKGLRKLALQLGTGLRILSQDSESVTYLAQPKRKRRSAEELAAENTVAYELDL